MDKQREQFEAWAEDAGYTGASGPDGNYAWSRTQAAWEGWQARAAQAAPGEAVTIEQLRGLLEAVRVFRNEPMLGALTKLRGTQSYHDMTVAWKDADDFIRDLAAPAQTEPGDWNAAIEAAAKALELLADGARTMGEAEQWREAAARVSALAKRQK